MTQYVDALSRINKATAILRETFDKEGLSHDERREVVLTQLAIIELAQDSMCELWAINSETLAARYELAKSILYSL